MFDEEYMKSHNKPVEGAKDIAMMLAARFFCSNTPCNECAVKMYEETCSACDERYGIGCISASSDRQKLVKAVSGVSLYGIAKKGLKGIDAQQVVYEALFVNQQKPEVSATSQGEQDAQTCARNCETCKLSEMHSSGIVWCKSFGNFVHSDGFCYRYEPKNVEELAI